MNKYTVKTVMDNGHGWPLHLQTEVFAVSAREAIRVGHRKFAGPLAYPGPFRGTSAENIEDAHDYARDTV